LTVWDHHTLPDEKQDHWIRGVQEWIAMAEAMNTAGYDDTQIEPDKGKV